MLCHTPSSVAGVLKHFEIHTSFQNSYEQIKDLNSLLYQDCIYGTKSLAEAQGLKVKKKKLKCFKATVFGIVVNIFCV